jgi:4a-hydroxytetrahydrobiopterin dehydratase
MSEDGWRDFLAAEGVEDWVVLYGGATAVFRPPSLGAAAQLAEAVSRVPGLDGSGALLTIGDGRLSVRLASGVFRLEERHITLARAVSAVAREHGAAADRTGPHEVQLAIAAKPDAVDVGFWRAVLAAENHGQRGVEPARIEGSACTTRTGRRSAALLPWRRRRRPNGSPRVRSSLTWRPADTAIAETSPS